MLSPCFPLRRVKHASKSASEAQGKLQEKKAIMNSNRGRLVTLQGKSANLLRDEGGIQKIKQCVRAFIRNERQQEHFEDGGELNSECFQPPMTSSMNFS